MPDNHLDTVVQSGIRSRPASATTRLNLKSSFFRTCVIASSARNLNCADPRPASKLAPEPTKGCAPRLLFCANFESTDENCDRRGPEAGEGATTKA
eukprot:1253701-Alexandrium_andersonii.AAC.1